MDLLVAFLTGALVTLAEIMSKYQRAPRQALLNPWACALVLLNGMASAGVYLVVQDTKAITFYVTNAYAKAFLIGVGWQVLLRSKVFTLGDPEKGKDIQIGLEHFYKKYSAIFENQIEMIEEKRVLAAIRELLEAGELPEMEVRRIGAEFVDYKQARKKITKTEAAELRKFINRSNSANIMYLVFEMSNLSTLRELFSATDRTRGSSGGESNGLG